ncbi:putative low molecular weight protein-tyrosine-phosphatase slr0328 isoform X1 [Juglans microcarpa x Juglans regia]|uniref:putative low molecular weight protein-tyrosine-phosphatase slr0328 isoform X1 n=1 Tax=Juglans microcarpa x Juglans regia TaxID=2249226 RepID=UPI001B7F1434|nr:putative low molecular weight protein-tyrosine-phosphatase slr0328 isoform X1 [Juglans microcarpa x Juglans regia]
MRALQSILSCPLNLQCGHSFHPQALSPKPQIPVLLPPTQYPPLQNSIPSRVPCRPTSSFSFGSLIKSSMASSATPDTDAQAATKPFSVLFVCLGNICRSPAAEGVFTDLVKKRGLDSKFNIDSAGTIDYHEGNQADPRMRAASKRRGVEIISISRPIRPSDFRDFDLILAMDRQNREDILEAFNRWKFRETLPADAHKKVKLMCSYCKEHDETEVPDPYYGGPQGFEKVLDLLEDACGSLLDSILAENKQIQDS